MAAALAMRVPQRWAALIALAALCLATAVEAGSTHPIDLSKRRGLNEAAAAAAPPASAPKPEYASDRIIVSFHTNVVSAMAAEQEGLEFQKPAGLQGAIVYTITDGTDVESKIQQLQNHPAVALVEPDYKVTASFKPDDANFGMQWHHPVISSERAWDTNTGSSTVKVCHVDSGVRVDHPDLAPNVLKGWNFVPPSMVQGQTVTAGTPDYFNYNDTYGHGTHTAGIIGAVGNNRQGIAGVVWNVKLLVCRFIWNDGTGYVSDAMNCLKLCKQEGALITSNSWGGIGFSSFLEREIATTQASGQLFVVASGNLGVDLDDLHLYPASYKSDNMISVGSSGANDVVSKFSNVGKATVHMLAPGEAIYSTSFDGTYTSMWGTSMACPMVAGTAALLQATAMSRGVTLTYGEMKSLITASVDRVAAASDKTITGGRLNVAAALVALDMMLTARGVSKAVVPQTQLSPPSPPLPRPPPPPRPSPPPPTSLPPPTAPGGAGAGVAVASPPVCGTTVLRGLNSATQSSTNGVYRGNLAIDGDCRKRRVALGSCSQTTSQPNSWWAVKLPAARPVLSVAIQTSAECNCVSELRNARILVGTSPWTSHLSAANFTLCSNITGIVRGQRRVFECVRTGARGSPPTGQYVAIWRPGPVRRMLTLCEVDVVLGGAMAVRSLPKAAGRRRAAARRLQANATPGHLQVQPGSGQQLQ